MYANKKPYLDHYHIGAAISVVLFRAGKNHAAPGFLGRGYISLVMNLACLPSSSDAMHFRLWTEVQAVDIWTNDFITYHGILSNFTSMYRENDDWHEKDSFISEQAMLDTGIAKRVYGLFSENHILDMPEQDSIAGWRWGNDGETFVMEYATLSHYSLKEYWNKLIQNFISQIKYCRKKNITLPLIEIDIIQIDIIRMKIHLTPKLFLFLTMLLKIWLLKSSTFLTS